MKVLLELIIQATQQVFYVIRLLLAKIDFFEYRVDRNLVLYQARGGTQEAISSSSSLPK